MSQERRLLEGMPSEELEKEIAATISEFHGLLTREAALRLIARGTGMSGNDGGPCSISGICSGQRKITIKATVKKVWPVASYASGKKSRVIELADDTGSVPLVLWNDDTAIGHSLRSGDVALVEGAYERNGELHLGYAGKMEVSERAPFTALDGFREGEPAHVRGVVSAIWGEGRFTRGGTSRNGFSFSVSDGGKEVRCVIWEGIGRGRKLAQGDEVIIENAVFSGGELGLSGDARLMSRRRKDLLLGRVDVLECRGDGLYVKVGGREALLDRENAMRFLGVEMPADISLETVATLKKDSLVNTDVAIKAGEKDGRIIIEG